MKESYVSYGIAVKLKECGFDWECNHYYPTNEGYIKGKRHGGLYDNKNHTTKQYCASAPTLTMAQKWLREVKGIDVEVVALLDPIRIKKNYKANLCYFDKDDKGEKYANYKVAALNIPTYELALSAGIDAALKLLKR